jgi:hypothetical protein
VPARAIQVGGQPQRVKTLFVPEEHLVRQLTGDRPLPWVSNLPRGFRVVACTLDPARRGLVLTLEVGTFELVAPGEPIPELTPLFAGGR